MEKQRDFIERNLILQESISYYLMLKDQPVLACNVEEVTIFNHDFLPLELKAKSTIRYNDVVQWASNRVLQIQREHAKTILHVLFQYWVLKKNYILLVTNSYILHLAVM